MLLRFFGLFDSSRVLGSWPGAGRLLSRLKRAMYASAASRLIPLDGLSRQRGRQALTVAKCPAPSGGLCPDSPLSSDLRNLRTNVIPSHDVAAFGSPRPPPTRRRVVPVLPSRRLPAFIGRNFITTTESSATSHRFTPASGLPLRCGLSGNRPPAPETIRGFPSYLGLPVSYRILKHASGLTRYRALRYFAR